MVYVKSVLAGLVALLLSVTLFVGGKFVFVWAGTAPLRGDATSSFSGESVHLFPWGFVIGILIFGIGFIWELRRASR
jgi:hypothetical protein